MVIISLDWYLTKESKNHFLGALESDWAPCLIVIYPALVESGNLFSAFGAA